MPNNIKNNANEIDNLFSNADKMSDFLWTHLVEYMTPYILACSAAKNLPYRSYSIVSDYSIKKMTDFLTDRGYALPELAGNSCDASTVSGMLAEMLWDSCSKSDYALIKRELNEEGAYAYLKKTKDALIDEPAPAPAQEEDPIAVA
jgi:hypothetical protein